jgi:hypothetical protein
MNLERLGDSLDLGRTVVVPEAAWSTDRGLVAASAMSVLGHVSFPLQEGRYGSAATLCVRP